MRILIYNEKTGVRGGVESYVSGVINEMTPRGYQFECLNIDVNKYSSYCTSRIPKFHRVKEGLFYNTTVGKIIEQAIDRWQPEVIHVNNNAYFTATILKIANNKGIPVIQVMHDYRLIPKKEDGLLTKWSKKARLRIVQKRAAHFIAPSFRLKEILNQHGIDQYTYIHYYIERDLWKLKHQLDRKPVILYIGRLEVVKGVFVLLSAWEQIAHQFPDHKLLFIGEGTESDNLKKAIASSPVKAQIEILPFQPQPIIKEHLYSSKLIVVPSAYREMFGIIGLEAAACSIPVIATNVAGIPEWCIHEQTGSLVEMNDIPGHANAMIRMLNDKELRQRLATSANQYAAKHFDKQKAVDSLDALYQRLSY